MTTGVFSASAAGVVSAAVGVDESECCRRSVEHASGSRLHCGQSTVTIMSLLIIIMNT